VWDVSTLPPSGYRTAQPRQPEGRMNATSTVICQGNSKPVVRWRGDKQVSPYVETNGYGVQMVALWLRDAMRLHV
jgi:hypothetical protein